MKPEELDQLEQEVILGDKAQKAYDLYVKDHIMVAKAQIIMAFESASSGDEESIMATKRLHVAIVSLETSILRDIETGQLASKTLTIDEEIDNG